MADDFEYQRFTLEDVGRSRSPASSQQQSAPPPPPPPPSGGCFRGCLIGCGIVAILLVIIGLVAAYFLPKFFSFSPAEGVRRMKAEVGADLPAGYQVVWSMTVPGMNMFVVMPKDAEGDAKKNVGEGTMFFVVSAPSLTAEQLNEQIKVHRNRQGIDPGEEKEEFVEMKFGGTTISVRKSTSKTRNGREIVQYTAPVRPGVLVWGMSTPMQFDQNAFQTLITSILSVPAKEEPKEPAKKAG